MKDPNEPKKKQKLKGNATLIDVMAAFVNPSADDPSRGLKLKKKTKQTGLFSIVCRFEKKGFFFVFFSDPVYRVFLVSLEFGNGFLNSIMLYSA